MGLVRYADDGFFAPRKIAEAFRTTSEEVARTAGLGKDAVQRKERVRSDRTQRRAARKWSRSSTRSSRVSGRR